MRHGGANRRIGNVGAGGRTQPYIPGPVEPLGILTRDYWDILAKQGAAADPVLMVRGLHALSEGLLAHNKPTRADGEMASNIFHYFSDLAHYNIQSSNRRKIIPKTRHNAELAKKGWSLVLAEDAICLTGLISQLTNPSVKKPTLKPLYREEAQALLVDGGDEAGVHINATQGLLYDRIRGVVPGFRGVFALGGAVLAAENHTVRLPKEYCSVGFYELVSKQAAREAFLINVSAHRSL